MQNTELWSEASFSKQTIAHFYEPLHLKLQTLRPRAENLPKPRNLKTMPTLPPPLPARPKKPYHQDVQKWGENELVNGSEDEDTYEPPPTERPMRTSTPTEPINDTYYMERQVSPKPPTSLPKPGPRPLAHLPKVQNNKSHSEPANMHLYLGPNIAKASPMNKAFQDTLPILPPRSHKQSQLLTPVENIDDGEYLEFDHIESSGSKSSLDARSQPSITPRGANLPTPVTKPPVPIRKPIGKQNLLSNSWYASMCDRKAAEAVLYENGKDGAFLVRPSSGCGRNQPYTLAVLYKGKVYNIPIRLIEGSNQYVLGKEKAGEMRFHSVQGMIDNYQHNTLILIDQQNNTKDSTLLLYPVQL
ncbi:B-cell linker protein-like isoform X2 [Scyliorhinus canicula]|uniref:B-cell linker protein-like isoform X2 n=1 Tax=Scyliorhinus canicula TaxID=7830 RepID=UPI0018F5B3B6|nr:B-cell linker protein-like isoform X2 [Scyliorhinus canicula]